MSRELGDAAMSLPLGTISSPAIKSDKGYHIVMAVARGEVVWDNMVRKKLIEDAFAHQELRVPSATAKSGSATKEL